MEDEFSAEAFRKARAKRQEEERREAESAAAADPELAAIRAQTARAQQDTLESSRTATRQLKETVEVGEATKSKLKQQGEQLERIHGTAERADENAQQSYEYSRKLHKHKGILPFSVKNWFRGAKKKEQDKELKRKEKELDREAAEREAGREAAAAGGVSGSPQQNVAPRREYGDEKEREIDENLDEMSSHLTTLRSQATEMNEELDKQKTMTDKTQATVGHTEYTIDSANRKIREFM
jgi:hypothetical protein